MDTAPTAAQIEALKIERTRIKSAGQWVRLVEGGRYGGKWYTPCAAPTQPYWDGRRWRKANGRFSKTPYHLIAIDVPSETVDPLFERGRRWVLALAAGSGIVSALAIASTLF